MYRHGMDSECPPSGLKAVTGGLLKFESFHRHNVVIVACLQHLLFFLAILSAFLNVDAPEPT